MFAAQPGFIVGNRYTLTHVIGRGGMGEVWKAHDRELDSACAVKFILQHLAGDRGIRERFAREAKAVARLRSPHVVHILGVGEVEDIPYLAMELLDGETLLARLERIGRLHPAITLRMVEQVAEALESAHQSGIVHRDLKPDNIWFWSGNKVFIKVLDFGVAKTGMTTVSLQTATGALVGTPQYMSPEQALGNRDIDHRSDLWSLAVITIECLSGKRPFDSAGLGDLLLKIVGASPPPLSELAPELPASLQQWWVRALARDPRDRFQSATELVEALRPHLAQLEADWVAPHGMESERSVPIPVFERAHGMDSAARSTRATGTPPILLSNEPAFAPSVSPVSIPASAPIEPLAAARGALGAADAPGGSSGSARSPGSLGPISSSRQPAQRQHGGRRRMLLLAGGVLAAALLVTAVRLFTAPEPPPALSNSPAVADTPTPGVAAPEPAPAATPSSPEPAGDPTEAAGVGVRPVQEPGPLEQPSPWEPALRGKKGNEPSSVTQALQPVSGTSPRGARGDGDTADAPTKAPPAPPPAPAAAPVASPKPPAASPRSGSGSEAAEAPAKPPAESPAKPQSTENTAKPGSEAAPPGAASHNPAVETEAERKERLRKATGL